MQRAQTFLANYSEVASCEIMNPPESIEMAVSGGPSFHIKRGVIQDKQNELPYDVQKISGGIRISRLDPNVSMQTAKKIWHHNAPGIELEDGSRRYRIIYDVPLMGVAGAYVVKGNTIIEHYFIVRNEIIFGPAFLIIFIYLCGAGLRKTVRWIRCRHR